VSSVYRVTGSIHDQILTEGAAEVVTEASAEISIVATNIDAIVEVANNIDDDLSSLPDAVAEANAAAVRAETAATSAIGTDTLARGWADAAATSAVAAAGSAATASEIAGNVADAAETAQEAALQAEEGAALAERWANEAPEVEVADGKFSALHYASLTEQMLASAPNLQFRTFGDHAGEEGVNSVNQVFNNAAGDFGRGIAVNRLATRTTTLKLLAGLYSGPPTEGADLAMVPTVVVNIGASDCTIEGPTAGSIVIEPSLLLPPAIEVAHDTTLTQPIGTRTVTRDVPAGTNRRFVAVQGIMYHTSQAVQSIGLTCSAAGATVTQRDQVGDGNHAGAQPIKATIWTGTLPDGPALPATVFTFELPALWCSHFEAVVLVQDAGGVEDYDLTQRAGTALTETFTGLSPSIAESMAVVFALHQGNPANPVAISPAGTLTQGKTPGGRTVKDFSYCINVHSDRPASGLTYDGSSAYGSPAVIGGVVFTPVTSTVTGTALLWKGTPPAVLAPGNMGVFWAMSDGLRYVLDMVES
jgi:hypothetical protein